MASVVVEKREELGFAATELRLGLPGDGEGSKSSGKRGFAETTIDWKLKLPTIGSEGAAAEEAVKRSPSKKNLLVSADDEEKPHAPKAQVVGWPPVRSFRKNIMSVHSDKGKKDEGEKSGAGAGAAFVKVSMDGAPYLRKVDLKMYKSYDELSTALEQMFSTFTAEYVPTYEDKDGDWMLVGDVPWEMFVDSCKRLRIMKGSEAIGFAPRAMEKFKSRS